MVLLLAAGFAAAGGNAVAAPSTTLVIAWAPGAEPAVTAPLAAARTRGTAVIEITPEVEPRAAEVGGLRTGQAAYDELRFAEAVTALGEAARSLEATGGHGLSQHQLSDIFLLRALAAVQLGEAQSAWDDFVRAATLAPTRALDPARFPPRAVEQFERARSHVSTLPRLVVRLTREPGCKVVVDGNEVGEAELSLVRGRHYAVATCPARRPVQRSFELLDVLELPMLGAPLAAPTDEAALVQARALGASAVVIFTATASSAVLRRLGSDGREQARTSVALGVANSARALERELMRMLELRPASPTPWYRSRWTWAAAGAAAAAAVLLPLALRDDGAPTVVIRPDGAPW